MPTLTPEEPQFDRFADYRNTLESFGLAFAAAEREGAVFDAGEGVRVIAGNAVATESLSLLKGANTLHLVVVEVTDGACTSYRYDMHHVDERGEPFGEKFGGIFINNFGNAELDGHSERESQRVRDWLEAAGFDPFEAMMAAPDQVRTQRVEVVYDDERLRRAKSAARWARLGRWLAWLMPNRSGENG